MERALVICEKIQLQILNNLPKEQKLGVCWVSLGDGSWQVPFLPSDYKLLAPVLPPPCDGPKGKVGKCQSSCTAAMAVPKTADKHPSPHGPPKPVDACSPHIGCR